jgi:arylsulfatase
VTLRVPKFFNLRTDPYERADLTSNTYWDWLLDRAFLIYPMSDIVGGFLQTFLEYPPRMKAASFTIDQAQEKLEAAIAGGH